MLSNQASHYIRKCIRMGDYSSASKSFGFVIFHRLQRFLKSHNKDTVTYLFKVHVVKVSLIVQLAATVRM